MYNTLVYCVFFWSPLLTHITSQATNLQFMAEYGNPMLAMDEAGYYLTSLEAAVAFIESLEPQQLDLTGV